MLPSVPTMAYFDGTFLAIQEVGVEFKDAWAEDEGGFPESVPGFRHWERAHFDGLL